MLEVFSMSARRMTPTTPTTPDHARAIEVLRDVPPAPTSASQAFECLTTVSTRLREHADSRAVFPDVYAVVTRRVRDSISGAATGLFDESEFISRLAGRFCELYLRALQRSLEGDPAPCAAWATADRRKASARVLPVQHAMLGLNAHINFDLALGLLTNVLSFVMVVPIAIIAAIAIPNLMASRHAAMRQRHRRRGRFAVVNPVS